MRGMNADWGAVERALQPHQLQTLREYATARGLDGERMWSDVVCCTVAVTLAVRNIVASKHRSRETRQALTLAALELDIDVETLRRRVTDLGEASDKARESAEHIRSILRGQAQETSNGQGNS